MKEFFSLQGINNIWSHLQLMRIRFNSVKLTTYLSFKTWQILYEKNIFLIKYTVKLHQFQKETRICLVSFNWVSIFWRSQQWNCFIRGRKCDDKGVHDLPHSLKIGRENMATAQCSKTNLMFLPTPNYWISGCDVIMPDSPYKNGLSRIANHFPFPTHDRWN